jgi:Bifunctional DNA primase/polymerase, N-terminal
MNSLPANAANHKARSEWLAIAVAYARRDWSIVRVKGKCPVGLWKPFQRQAPDKVTLARLFRRRLAVILGRASGGLAVRDFDRVASYRAWERSYSADAVRVPTVRTRRGFHVFGRLDHECFVTLPDGELRADAGAVSSLPTQRPARPLGSRRMGFMPTVGEIARRLNEPVHRIEYVRTRDIKPTGVAGNARVLPTTMSSESQTS